MTSTIPPALKAADIGRFAHRAGQLESQRPVVAYYCYYWIIDQILSKGLQKADNDAMSYTTTLMDKLEQMKSTNSETDAIADDVAGHAYVEQFGLETFQRAENAMKANKVTRQTADTFQAAATFLELVQIWGTLEAELSAKIKFAKYHALRIAKAIKAGEDPNLSNPAPEPELSPETESTLATEQPLDPNDPEVQAINGTGETILDSKSRQPTVENEEDDSNRSQAFSSHQFYGAPPSPLAPVDNQAPPLSPLGPGEHYYTNPNLQPDVSPLGPPSAERKSSVGGGYFPTVPDQVGHVASSASDVSPPDAMPPQDPGNVANQPPQTQQPFSQPASHTASTPRNNDTTPRIPPPQPAPISTRQPVTAAPPPVAPVPVSAPTDELMTDEEAILAAQKHARWAISALNFEDVKTAVKELQEALQVLGVR